MKRINVMLAAGAVLTLLAGWAGAEMTAVSDTPVLVDTRSYTENWSNAGLLDTKMIVGTMISIR